MAFKFILTSKFYSYDYGWFSFFKYFGIPDEKPVQTFSGEYLIARTLIIPSTSSRDEREKIVSYPNDFV